MGIHRLNGRTAVRRQRVTINDVASKLSMTKGTVSRALNGYSDISERTRLRVVEAAEKLGYRPLANAQSIRTGRVRSIGLVLQLNEHDRHRPFLADFLAGVSEAASAAGWTITVSTATSDHDTLRLLRELSDERKADGFILPRTLWDDPRIDLLRDANVPFVLYGRSRDLGGCAWFDIAGEDAMVDAIRELALLGHERIGFIPGLDRYMYARLRLEGYKTGLVRAGLEFDPALISGPARNSAEGEVASRDLLRISKPPTAILCSVDRAAIGVYATAEKAGLQIGRDLSLISYDGTPEGELMRPPLSTYSADTRNAGGRLTELLIRRIDGEPPEALRELVPAIFLSRGSHGRACLSSERLAEIIITQTLVGGKSEAH